MAAFEPLVALYAKATSEAETDARKSAATELAEAIKGQGVAAIMSMALPAKVMASLAEAKNVAAREGAVFVVGQLLEIVPKVTENMWDTKPEVKQAAKSSWRVLHGHPQPRRSRSCRAHLANANPKENVTALDRLMGTTFVSQVDRPTLAIIVPVLGRGPRPRRGR
ncbi:protein kinase regulator [Aureococcus anophagefferens]|nr:protein kinase regulator [Aureococcus anophagefferens]